VSIRTTTLQTCPKCHTEKDVACSDLGDPAQRPFGCDKCGYTYTPPGRDDLTWVRGGAGLGGYWCTRHAAAKLDNLHEGG